MPGSARGTMTVRYDDHTSEPAAAAPTRQRAGTARSTLRKRDVMTGRCSAHSTAAAASKGWENTHAVRAAFVITIAAASPTSTLGTAGAMRSHARTATFSGSPRESSAAAIDAKNDTSVATGSAAATTPALHASATATPTCV